MEIGLAIVANMMECEDGIVVLKRYIRSVYDISYEIQFTMEIIAVEGWDYCT